MKTHFALGCFALMLVSASFAQRWKKISNVALSDTLKTTDVVLMALDADTVLDMAWVGERSAGSAWLVAFHRQDSAWEVRSKTGLALLDVSMQREDWNKDGLQDLLVRGRASTGEWTLTAYENQGNFTWKKQVIPLPSSLPRFRIADADGDGRWDILVFGNEGLQIYAGDAAGFTRIYEQKNWYVRDVISFRFRSLALSWVISGNTGGKPFTRVLRQDSRSAIQELKLPQPVDGLLTVADFNRDGRFDVGAVGQDSLGLRLRSWIGTAHEFLPAQAQRGLTSTDYFSANLNETRGIEQFISGTDSLGAKHMYFIDSAGLRRDVPWQRAAATRFADLDRDGDLDGICVIDSLGRQWLQWHQNQTDPRDQRPSAPFFPAAFSLYGRTLLFWQPATDDLTASESITYDVWLAKESENIITPAFSRAHRRRATVAHGNAGNSTVFQAQQLTDDRYFYFIQAVDHATNGSYKECTGGVSLCFDLQEIRKQVCQNEFVQLTAPGDAAWFSIRGGYLGSGASYRFTATASDTLFSIVPQSPRCADHRIWIIHVNPAAQNLNEVRYACPGADVVLSIPAGWPQITWQTTPPIVNLNTIRHTVTKNERLTVIAKAGLCDWRKEFDLRISKPALSAVVDSLRILRGAEVTLAVTATAGALQWTPATGLASPQQATTVAVPARTTTYTATLTDTLGCQAQTRVVVEVDFTAFVPNLFSPNGDNSNDHLLIYGLDETVVDFRFQIFNREGSIVYATRDEVEATTRGWDGLVGGIRQAAGLYYWKVSGKTARGEKLLLNGKTSGDILLVH